MYSQIKVDEELGYPTCDQEGCDSPVHVTLIWDEPKQYCWGHTNQVLHAASAMGFSTPDDTAQRFDLMAFTKWQMERED